MARDLPERAGLCSADRADHAADRALEHQGSDCTHGALDASVADRANAIVTNWRSGSGAISSAGAGGDNVCGESNDREVGGGARSTAAGDGPVFLDGGAVGARCAGTPGSRAALRSFEPGTIH